MRIYQELIEGSEPQSDRPPAFTALTNFYKAFNQRDLASMEQNWSGSNEISMCNPLGGIYRGWPEIRALYRRIFDGPARVFVEFHDFSFHETATEVFVSGRERGFCEVKNTRLQLAIRTTRIFTLENLEWRQIHHHGSIEDPELLRSYRSLITAK